MIAPRMRNRRRPVAVSQPRMRIKTRSHAADVIYTCPMHPQIRQIGPGNCPICGMTLEPLVASTEAEPNAELVDMTRRFWIGLALTAPVLVLGDGRPFLQSASLASRRKRRIGFSSFWRRRSCFGPAGRFLFAARNRS